MTLCTFYILVYASACDELWFFMWLLFYLLHYYGGCQYVKGTKQILIAVCCWIYWFTFKFLVCKLQFYTVNFTVCSVNVFTVFLYFLQNYSGNHSCQNYFVKTTVFFFTVMVSIMSVKIPHLLHLMLFLWKHNSFLCHISTKYSAGQQFSTLLIIINIYWAANRDIKMISEC